MLSIIIRTSKQNRPPPTSAGGGLLRLQFYAVLPVLLLTSIRGLLLPPHKPNDLLHLFGTEIVPDSPEITFHRIELRILSFYLFQLLAQMAGSFLLVLIEVQILIPLILDLPVLPMEGKEYLHQLLDQRHGLLLPIALGGLKCGCFWHPFFWPLGVLR